MNENDKIAAEIEAEKLRREQEKSKPKKISHSQVKEAKFIWMAGILLIDLLTSALIWAITGYWYYALVWIAAGAGGLLWSERQKERIGNNIEQIDIGDLGVKVSGVLVFVMAVTVGLIWVTKSKALWLDAVMEITAVVLFFYHLFQAYRYHQVDDEVIASNEEARSEEEAKREIRAAHRAARLVESKKVKSGVVGVYQEQHGAAFNAALGLDVEQPRLRNNNHADPTQPPRRTD